MRWPDRIAVCQPRGNPRERTRSHERHGELLERTEKHHQGHLRLPIEPFHLFRYLDEQSFRFNEREDDDQGRFLESVMDVVSRRLTWLDLTA